MVADALNTNTYSMGSLFAIGVEERVLAKYVQILANSFFHLMIFEETGGLITFIDTHSSSVEQICECQFDDEKLSFIRDTMIRGEAKEVVLDLMGFRLSTESALRWRLK